MPNQSKRRTAVQIIYAVLVFVAGTILGVIAQEYIDKHVLSQQNLILAIILVCVVALGTIVLWILGAVQDLRPPPQPTVRYYELQPDHEQEADLYHTARQFVKRAEKRIWATSSLEGNDWVPDPDAHAEHELYFKEIIRRTRKKREKGQAPFEYWRILQLKDSTTIPPNAGSEEFRAHLHMTADERDINHNESAALTKTTFYRPGTLVIIDSEYLLWEIDERIPAPPQQAQTGQEQPPTDHVRMRGFFVIHDPIGDTIKPFEVFFTKLMGVSNKVEQNELP